MEAESGMDSLEPRKILDRRCFDVFDDSEHRCHAARHRIAPPETLPAPKYNVRKADGSL